MTNRALIAVAGSGKTETIIQEYKGRAQGTLFVTFTQNGQDELKQRLHRANPGEEFEVIGWFKFLADHFLKPFMCDFSHDRDYAGLAFGWRPNQRAKGDARYFNSKGEISSHWIGYVARKISENNNGEPIKRLERIFKRIVFDEAQDLAASDLVVLEFLLRSKLEIFMVGDVRQTVYETNTSDRKYREYRQLGKINWFKDMAKKGLLELNFDLTNRRCHADIVKLANVVLKPEFEFEDAISGQQVSKEPHTGIFRITEDQIPKYCRVISPQGLRYSAVSASKWAGHLPLSNFGDVKGMTFDHVLIFPTRQMIDFLSAGTYLESDETTAKFYVALTRARHSVCFVLPENTKTLETINAPIKWWP